MFSVHRLSGFDCLLLLMLSSTFYIPLSLPFFFFLHLLLHSPVSGFFFLPQPPLSSAPCPFYFFVCIPLTRCIFRFYDPIFVLRSHPHRAVLLPAGLPPCVATYYPPPGYTSFSREGSLGSPRRVVPRRRPLPRVFTPTFRSSRRLPSLNAWVRVPSGGLRFCHPPIPV